MKVISFENGVMVVGEANQAAEEPVPSFNATPEQSAADFRASVDAALKQEQAIVPNESSEPESEPTFEPSPEALAQSEPEEKEEK
ncbi:hypothetical protein GNAINCEL_00055 [Serratia phage KKP 3709]|nr:hypothetical protein GNAINCEL_00055 [Serratia phage KKP 3709]